MRIGYIAAFAFYLAGTTSALAQEECNFETNGGQIAVSYELIGAEACAASCTDTESCTAWLYTPHNFNPDGAPGECALYAEASGIRAPDETASTQYCGMIE